MHITSMRIEQRDRARINTKDGEQSQGLLELIPKETVDELKPFSEECLNRTGLKELMLPE